MPACVWVWKLTVTAGPAAVKPQIVPQRQQQHARCLLLIKERDIFLLETSQHRRTMRYFPSLEYSPQVLTARLSEN